jgi:phosphoglycerate dehydrogenase-like enzyme
MTRPLVLVTESLSDTAAAWLAERCDVVRCAADDPRFHAELRRADAMIVRTYTIVDEAMLAGAPRLRVVGRAGAGVDNIDVEACKRRGIVVCSTPDANTQAVVEYVLALMLDALRPRAILDRAVSKDSWNHMRASIVGERQLADVTLGILGMGRIGRRVAEIAAVIGMGVFYNDLVEIEPRHRHRAEPVDVARLFAISDVLTIHIDGRESNRRFVSPQLIERMKANVVLINTSRGFVIDAPSLAAFLRQNPGATAMLDVHEPEPIPPDYPVLGLPNARLYPHLASRTHSAMENMSWVVRDVWAALRA